MANIAIMIAQLAAAAALIVILIFSHRWWLVGPGTLAAVAFHADGALLAAGDADARVLLWEVPATQG